MLSPVSVWRADGLEVSVAPLQTSALLALVKTDDRPWKFKFITLKRFRFLVLRQSGLDLLLVASHHSGRHHVSSSREAGVVAGGVDATLLKGSGGGGGGVSRAVGCKNCAGNDGDGGDGGLDDGLDDGLEDGASCRVDLAVGRGATSGGSGGSLVVGFGCGAFLGKGKVLRISFSHISSS